MLWDEEDEIAKHYRPEGMPATFVLDEDGTIAYSHVGSGDREWDDMVAFLERKTAGK